MLGQESLCESCAHGREIVSETGSRFLLCRLSQSDRRFPKYPPQPVVRCDGHVSPPEGSDDRAQA